MVLSFWGINRNQRQLARQLQMIPGAGVPGSRVLRLRTRNLDVLYERGDLGDLRAALDQGVPPIVLVNTKHFDHWKTETAHAVVVTAMDEQRVLINDPSVAQGPVSVSLDDFYLAWDEMANLYSLIQKI